MSRILRLAPLLLLMGCEQLDPFLPTVQFGRLDVQDLDWQQIDTDFVFYVDNPNPVEIPLASFEYALALADVELISGADPDGLELLASDMSELALPVSLEFTNVYDLIVATRGLDDVPFGLDGSFGFDSPLGVIELPYDAGGDFPALRTPDIELGELRIVEISWTSATLELDLDIDNDHGSTVFFENFDYALELEGTQVASGLISDFASVDGATTYTTALPLEVDFISAGEAIYSALTGSTIDVGIEATTDVITPFEDYILPLSLDKSGRIDIED